MALRLGTTPTPSPDDGDNSDDENGGSSDNEQENDDSGSNDENLTCDDIAVNPSINPFEGKNLYVNPTYQTNLDSSIATASGTTKTNLQQMRDTASAYWIDVKAKLTGTGTGTLEGILTDAATKGEMVTFMVYDLPNRDCNAHASNGEICCKYNTDGTCDYSYSGTCDEGLNEYKTEYIDVFAEVISRFDCLVDMALIIEPDSLPNLATNLDNSHCQNSVQSYTEGISYAIDTLSAAAPHATLYLDGAHGGWLGWADNVSAFVDIVRDLPYQKLRGFATNVANY